MAPAPPSIAQHESQALGSYLRAEIKARLWEAAHPKVPWPRALTAPRGEFNEFEERWPFSNRQGRHSLWVLGFSLSDLPRATLLTGGQTGQLWTPRGSWHPSAPPGQGDNEVREDGGLMGRRLWGSEGGRLVPKPWKLQPRRKGEPARVTKPPENRSDRHLPVCSRHVSREPSVRRPVQDAVGSAPRRTSHPLGSRHACQKREGESRRANRSLLGRERERIHFFF